jgi:pyruvyl transferase EpsO
MNDRSAARHGEAMHELSRALDAIGGVLPRGTPIAYLDYAFHFNVGDLLINLGCEALFERMGYDVRLRLSFFDLCEVDWADPAGARLKPSARRTLDALPADVVLVLHGGGNFGDWYPEYQALRESVVAHCPARRIVMLPQSLHFRDAAAQRRSLERLLAHRDLHLFLRDAESLDAVRAHAPDRGQLLPDMAHALWRRPGWIAPPAPAGAGTLWLRRRDGEALRGAAPGSFDWPDLVGPADRLAFRALRFAMHRDLDRRHRLAARGWQALSQRVVARARQRFVAHEAIATDRLHGLILAALLERPVRYLDNSYGKLSRYARAWLGASPWVRADDGGAHDAAQPAPPTLRHQEARP